MEPGQLVAFPIELGMAALFAVLGIVLWGGKGAWLIAGYNTSSKAGKSKYDEKSLCRFVSKLMFFYTACFIFVAISTWLEAMTLYYCLMTLFLVVTIAAVIYANTGNRFKKK